MSNTNNSNSNNDPKHLLDVTSILNGNTSKEESKKETTNTAQTNTTSGGKVYCDGATVLLVIGLLIAAVLKYFGVF